MHFATVVASADANGISASRVAVSLGSKMKLTELYVAHNTYLLYEFAQCTTLSSLNIIHEGASDPDLSTPPFLTRLCLHNMLSGSIGVVLQNLDGRQVSRWEVSQQTQKA